MQTILIIIGSIIAAFVVLIFIARAKMKNIPLVADHENIITLTDKNFQKQTKNKIVLVDFWASWCAPCRLMASVLNDVAKELSGNRHVGKVNIDQFQSLAQRYQVRGIPTMGPVQERQRGKPICWNKTQGFSVTTNSKSLIILMRKLLKILVNKRISILAILGISLYLTFGQYHISLWWVLAAGIVSGVIFGKVFCRWVCPMGFIMELLMGMSSDGKIRQMYQYHKMGCPIAWISGWLNKYSLFKIQLNAES